MKATNLAISIPYKGCDKNCPYCVSKMTGYNTADEDAIIRNRPKVKNMAALASIGSVLLTGKGEPLLNVPAVMEKYSAALVLLVDKKLITIDNSSITFTDEGNSIALELTLERSKMWYWYNDYFQKTISSKTHKKFRKKMFGSNEIHSHSSTSLKQIKAIMEDLSIHSGKTILELGSGDGFLKIIIIPVPHF